MSPGNILYGLLRAYDLCKKTVTASYTVKVGTVANQFKIDYPVIVEDPAADLTITVPDGVKAGQMVYIATKSNSGSKTITLSVSNHYTSSPETFTISTEGQAWLGMWDGERYGTIGGNATAT
jgi:hypothetical protein